MIIVIKEEAVRVIIDHVVIKEEAVRVIIDHVVIKEEAVTCVSWNFKENILAACTDDTRHRSVSSIL